MSCACRCLVLYVVWYFEALGIRACGMVYGSEGRRDISLMGGLSDLELSMEFGRGSGIYTTLLARAAVRDGGIQGSHVSVCCRAPGIA